MFRGCHLSLYDEGFRRAFRLYSPYSVGVVPWCFLVLTFDGITTIMCVSVGVCGLCTSRFPGVLVNQADAQGDSCRLRGIYLYIYVLTNDKGVSG